MWTLTALLPASQLLMELNRKPNGIVDHDRETLCARGNTVLSVSRVFRAAEELCDHLIPLGR